MNQILDHSGIKKSKPQSNPNDIKKIIKVFAIIILVFGVVLGGVGVFAVVGSKSSDSNETTVATSKPTINAEKDTDSSIKLEVAHEETIEKVEYKWDSEENSHVLKGSSDEKTITKEGIGIPTGTHSFYVKVTDIKGNEFNETFSFTCEDGVDAIDPEIDIVTQNYTIEIVATDETALSFMTYSINGGEEVTIEASEEDKTRISTVLEVEPGEVSTITVKAVDEANNEATKTKDLAIYAKPVVTAAKVSEADNQIKITITSTVPVSKVTLASSNETTGDSSQELSATQIEGFRVDSTEYNYKYELTIGVNDPGKTIITIRAYIDTVDEQDTYGEFVGSVEYN